jgi:hypothetical protein
MPLERYVNAFDDQAEVLATLDVGRMWDRMLREFLDEWVRLDRQGLSAEAIERAMEAHLDGLSDKPLLDLARQTSGVAYNQGRAAEIRSQPAVEYVVRSEVLDQNTCAPCAELDGSIVAVGTPEFDALMPPARCEGGDRCRGFYVALGSGGAT